MARMVVSIPVRDSGVLRLDGLRQEGHSIHVSIPVRDSGVLRHWFATGATHREPFQSL